MQVFVHHHYLREKWGVRLVKLHSIMAKHVLMNIQRALFFWLLRLLQFLQQALGSLVQILEEFGGDG